MMTSMQYAGLAVTVGLFFVTHFITLFKWINAMGSSIREVTVKMEERTSAIMNDLRKVNQSLETLATASMRLSTIERRLEDQEIRIRSVERDSAAMMVLRKSSE